MASIEASEFFKKVKNYQENINDDFEVPPMFLSTLPSYQLKGVKWMVNCEKNNIMMTSNGSKFRGGILADEMGLGKTIEMLCCILANTSPLEFYSKKSAFEDYQLESKSVSNNQFVECYCVHAPPNTTIVVCCKCGKNQHAECMNFNPKNHQKTPYLCANCWIDNDKFQCKATLIVVPDCLLKQWKEEIQTHVADPGLQIFEYNGVYNSGFIQPTTFNEYDIVLTSYSKLSRDLNFVEDFDAKNRKRLRYSKKYNYPKSPLPYIKWWRICLDEGQAIENVDCKVFGMISCLDSVNKWVMSGTPIQKSLHDLFGIVKFLDISPYCEYAKFCELMADNPDHIYSWFSNILWRNKIEEVNSELNIPPITHERHFLTFSSVEKCFYKDLQTKCIDDFSNKTAKLFPSLNVSMKEIDKQNVLDIIQLLSTLRQACVHPQVVNGQFGELKTTMTMENLLDHMIKNCRRECEHELQCLVSKYSNLADLCIRQKRPDEGVMHYREALDFIKKYSEQNIRVCPNQKIHIMYNLASALKKYKIRKHLSNDLNLKEDMKNFEKEYFYAQEQNIKSICKIVTAYNDRISDLLGEKTIEYSKWWDHILNGICLPKDFLTKLQVDVNDFCRSGETLVLNITKLKTINNTINILSVWLTSLYEAREKTVNLFQDIKIKSIEELFELATTCWKSSIQLYKPHMFTIKEYHGLCLLCSVKEQLGAYEKLLFNFVAKYNDTNVNDQCTDDIDNINNSFSASNNWKMSEKEFILQKLFEYGQSKFKNDNCVKDGAEHMHILDLVRKEFRNFQLFWVCLNDRLKSQDGIIKAKSRLKLKNVIESDERYQFDTYGIYKKEKYNKWDMLECYDSLTPEIEIFQSRLENQNKSLLFLENLKKTNKNSSEVEPCQICLSSGVSGWAVLPCGHSLCNGCFTNLFNIEKEAMYGEPIIKCPFCRMTTTEKCMSYVEEVPREITTSAYSTKVDSIVVKLMKLIEEDQSIKVLIFSTWDSALGILEEALIKKRVNHRRLRTGKKHDKAIYEFKTDKDINALLMKISSSSKGLNLTEASRVFFMEPIIDKNDEHQAIGRIHRLGQKKPMVVHHFILKDSIEENITTVFDAYQLNNWGDITLSQLIKVFQGNAPNGTLQPEIDMQQ